MWPEVKIAPPQLLALQERLQQGRPGWHAYCASTNVISGDFYDNPAAEKFLPARSELDSHRSIMCSPESRVRKIVA